MKAEELFEGVQWEDAPVPSGKSLNQLFREWLDGENPTDVLAERFVMERGGFVGEDIEATINDLLECSK